MKTSLNNIATLSTGVYAQPDIIADTYYLQANHFINNYQFDNSVKPYLKLENKYEKHLLNNGDILFAAKGFNNFAVVYNSTIGQAVASSSFIIIRISGEYQNKILPEYLVWFINTTPQIKVFHHSKAASTIPSISISQLKNLMVDFPNIEKQKLIIKIFQLRNQEKEIIKQIDIYKENLIQHKLLKASTK